MDERSFRRPVRRIGYVVSIVVNLVVLWIANNLLAWEWFPWLTDDFTEVLPWINASIIATILSSILFFATDDQETLKGPVDIVTTAISLISAVKLLTVFPFDFEPYSFPWEVMVRVVLGIAILGMTIGLIVNVVTTIRRIVR